MILRVALRFAFLEINVALDREFLREQLPEQHQDHACVDEMDADLVLAPLEALDERGCKPREQRKADEVSAREQRYHEMPPEKPEMLPPHNPTVEPNLLRLPQSQIDLRQRPEKDEQHRQCEADDREAQGGEKFPEAHGNGNI